MTQILDEVKLATIERLPNEVLHKIFSLAPNTDLARASPILALKMTDAGEGHYWTNLILEVMRSYWDTRLMDMRHVVLDEEVINNQVSTLGLIHISLVI